MPGPDLQLLLDAATRAGDIAMRHFKKEPKTWDKPGDAGPVTQADLEVDEALRHMLCTARPGYGWLSEETEDSPDRLSRNTVFIVDPIDGTRSFISGHGDFSHALSVVRDGQPVAAVVYLPARDLIYAAEVGRGATLNGKPIQVTDQTELQKARILAAKPQMSPDLWAKGPPPIDRHFRSSLAFRLSLVGQGRFDGMFTLRPSWEWDIAAGALIAAEAGARVTDGKAGPLRFNSAAAKTDGIMAANPDLHAGLAAYL